MRAESLLTKMATAGICTQDHSLPTHRHTTRLCISHRCALFITTISAVKPRPPAPGERIFLLFFWFNAAELKRFRSHPLSSAVNPRASRENLKRQTQRSLPLVPERGTLPRELVRHTLEKLTRRSSPLVPETCTPPLELVRHTLQS